MFLCGKVLIFNGMLLRFAVDLYDDQPDVSRLSKSLKNHFFISLFKPKWSCFY